MQFETKILLLAFQFAVLCCAASACRDNKYVAFTAALRPSGKVKDGWGSMGPFNHDSVLIHNTVVTNVGDAYNHVTGIFTSPYAGVFYFTFTNYAWIRAHWIGVALYKNNEEIVRYQEWQDKGDNEDYATNGATLVLKEGDQVSIKLIKSCITSAHIKFNVSTFSGFLLQQFS